MHFFIFFVQKSFLTKNYFLTAEIDLTIGGPLYTRLVYSTYMCIYVDTVIYRTLPVFHLYFES